MTIVSAADVPAGIIASAFEPRSGPLGATLFATLPAGETGIDAPNDYADPRMWQQRFREFTLGAIGTGVAICDYDGDGRSDVFIVSKAGPNQLFRNLGGFKFENVNERAGVAGLAWSCRTVVGKNSRMVHGIALKAHRPCCALIGRVASFGALYTAYSDHENGCVLLASAPLLPAVRFGQPNTKARSINGRKALARS